MKKLVLVFPAKSDIAEFLLRYRVMDAQADLLHCTLTGFFSESFLRAALDEFGAEVAPAPDFIQPE